MMLKSKPAGKTMNTQREEPSSPEVTVVIPCLNEEEGLRVLLPRLIKVADEIIVVDNGCTDNTVGVARSLGARVVKEERKGYGQAHQRGFAAATGKYIVTLDGDGTYPPEVIPEVIACLKDRGADFISCVRFPLDNPRAMFWKNYLGNRLTTILTRKIFGYEINDAMTGMWVFKKRIIGKLLPLGDGMEFSLEIKLKALAHQDIAFREFHIEYRERSGGMSKFHPIKDSIDVIAMLLRMRKRV
jgi:glycosyltransferase involved in cell wall biosynthesis